MVIEIRKTVKNDPFHKDVAFISFLCRKYGDTIGVDESGLADNDHITDIILNDSARIMLLDGEYLGFCYLDDMKKDGNRFLHASIHGMINTVDTKGKHTSKHFYRFKKEKIFDKLLIEYFKTYDIRTINAWLPEYLEEKILVKPDYIDKHEAVKRRKLPTAIILNDAGFRRCKDPIRNFVLKNNRPCAVFVYQLHQNWFLKNRGIA